MEGSESVGRGRGGGERMWKRTEGDGAGWGEGQAGMRRAMEGESRQETGGERDGMVGVVDVEGWGESAILAQ